MSHEYYRRGRNWYTAIGVLFMVGAGITLARQLVLWGPEFVVEFIFNAEPNSEKVSLGMIGFGIFMMIRGFTRNVQKR